MLKIETKKVGQYSEVSVYTSQNVKPGIITLDSPNRVALVFENSRIDSPHTLSGPTELIRIIQGSQFDEKTVYVMIEPNEELCYEYTSIIGRNKYVMEFSKAKPGSVKRIAPSEASEASKASTEEAEAVEVACAQPKMPPSEEAEIKAAPEEPPLPSVEAVATVIEKKIPYKPAAKKPALSAKKPAAVKKPTKTATVEISAVPLPLKGKIIVIDPGHGGRDPGYVGKSGIYEKGLTLKLALALKEMLNNAGAKVILSRSADVTMKKADIVALANNKGADMLVCLHFNAYTSPYVSGVQSFYFNPNGKPFARIVQKNLSRTVKKRDRGIKREMYYTIHHTKMPSVLIEAGYLTNPREEAQILTPAYRKIIASGICKGIKEYVKISSKWQK